MYSLGKPLELNRLDGSSEKLVNEKRNGYDMVDSV